MDTSPHGERSPRPIGARLFIALQHLLPQHALSRAVHRLARCRIGIVKNLLIRAFVRGYRPRLDEAAEPDPLRYPSFNGFFTRSLRAGARTIDASPRAVASPVDGTVSQVGHAEDLTLIQAKGHHYQIGALLGVLREARWQDASSVEPQDHGAAPEPTRHGARGLDALSLDWTSRLRGAAYATLYLAPYNYHRIHMPIAGTLKGAWYVPGRLFSVNATTAAAVTGLFARNERVVCAFESDDGLPFAMVLVGALFVGSIATRWHGDVTPCSPRQLRMLPLSGATHLAKGEEMGRFNMGSTVILLFPRAALDWRAGLVPGGRIEVGRALATLRATR